MTGLLRMRRSNAAAYGSPPAQVGYSRLVLYSGTTGKPDVCGDDSMHPPLTGALHLR